MRKINKIFIILFVFLLTMLFMTTICHADEQFKITSFDITAPTTGIYGVGTEITFTMKFSQPVKGTMPKLEIYFGKSYRS